MAGGSWIRINAVDAHLDAQTINSIIETTLGNRAKSITQTPDVRQKVGEALIAEVYDYIPKKSGLLSISGRATPDGRIYWTAIDERGYNYAAAVYDNDGTRWPDGEYANPSTDGTYPRWVEKLQPNTDEWEAFVNRVTPIIKEAFENE